MNDAPVCDKHNEKMWYDESLSEWFCPMCSRSISDEQLERLGVDPSRIRVT